MNNPSAIEWLIEKIAEKSTMEKGRYYIPYNSGTIDITDVINEAKEIEYDIQQEQYKRGHEHGRIEGYGEGWHEGMYDAENK